ncbi:visceral mesodermal armadillo-repeats [Rhynchophorus ferrugineus]|uniref:Rap1 GTPase-GDP dissociation stimulator 1 n=1 Tax=Rhynchophorus ferrugineus TaxID=354439 RepID=A0A834IIS3_RHYFE|nr:hypothetical protein GWI33_008100 [Rhynchophorus ferrugineus]
MENILNNFNSSVNSENEQQIEESLETIIDKANDLKINDTGVFKKCLKIDNKTTQTLGSQAIAELCANEENRKKFTEKEIIKQLMEFLESGYDNLTFSTVRALGNICYENKDASEYVYEAGITSILENLRNDSKRQDNTLTTKLSGLLVNLMSTHDDIPKAALDGGILPIVKALLTKYKGDLENNKILMMFLLNILNILTDYLDDKDYVFTEEFTVVVTEIFKASEIPEICVLCLEIFHPLSEKDEIKIVLAKEGVCELLYDLIEKYRDKVNDEDSRSILKMACDLIVLILTGDACMDTLYDEGNGKTYQNMFTWLDSSDSDLLSTGILAIGNFARKDTHCIQMVKNGVAKKLIDLLKNYNHSTDLNDVIIQHALLSTLKNLLIPKENKGQAIKDDIIEVMYPMLKQNHFTVVFKLLGTFRMVIDGQPEVAFNLLSRKDFIEKLVFWCYKSDHLGVRGEVPRIFSWLVRNTCESTPFSTFLSVPDSVKCIVEMISSNHGEMQNESFRALSILATGLSNSEKHSGDELDQYYQLLCDASIGKNLNFVMNKYGEKWDHHTINNCLILLDGLIKSDLLINHLKETDIVTALEKLKNNTNSKEYLMTINKINETLNK